MRNRTLWLSNSGIALLAKETSIIFYRSNQIFNIIKENVISLKNIVLNNRVFSANKKICIQQNNVSFKVILFLNKRKQNK